jgi:hypothetical protein
MPDKKPSVWREFWKGCHDLFWQSYGLDKVAEDVNTHGEAVRKGAALRFLAVIALFALCAGIGLRGCWDGSIEEELAKSNGAKQEAERDRDKYQTLFNQDENTMSPLRDTANRQFSAADPSKRLDLLIQKMDSFQNDIDLKISTFGKPSDPSIATAAASVSVRVEADKLQPTSHYVGTGGLVVLLSENSGILIGTCVEHDFVLSQDGSGLASFTCNASQDSPYLGHPISSLKDGRHMQINFMTDTIPVGAKITGGQVTWIINSSLTLKFDIPSQIAGTSTVNGTPTTRIIIPDISEGLKPLSSTPDKNTQ